MRKSSIIMPVVFVAFVVLTLSGCMSSATSGKASSSGKTVTVKMYVNAPDDLNAKAAELALQAANSNYQGVTSFSYRGTPTVASVGPVLTYYGYCESIKFALNTAYGDCKLSFNTQADGKGTASPMSMRFIAIDFGKLR